MKIRIERTRWARVRPQLKAVRLKNTIARRSKALVINYVVLLDPPKYYPRIHITSISSPASKYIVLKIHVDRAKHTESDYLHPKIQRIINQLMNS